MYAVAFALLLSLQDPASPEVLDPRLELQLVVREPDLVTPTGASVDARGRIWVVESNTHHVGKSYKGHPTDRILILDDFGPDGRARKIGVFADGFRYGMSAGHHPNGDFYFATRWEVWILRDKDGDGRCDERVLVAKLDTKGDYPHNGLCGFAFDAAGDVWFGMGENLGASYRLLGSDGSVVEGGGEGGNVFRCRADGKNVERIATGVWNPFHLCFDARGRLFVVDNDPDSRPPCRLLHIVQGGDYGFKFRNGRKGLHPFTSWNGELPGTLPMVSGTGEAPSGMIHYAHPAFPDEYQGTLLATSWGDHLIQRFTLSPKGASFTAKVDSIVKGGDQFRPVALVQAPDGSIVMSDWVDRSYPVHGKGRVWRLRAKQPGSVAGPSRLPEDSVELRRMNSILAARSPKALAEAIPALASDDPFLVSAAVEVLGRHGSPELLQGPAGDANPRLRLGALLALRRRGDASRLGAFLADADPGVRRAAIQWVGEEKLAAHAAGIEQAASKLPVTKEIFEAYLAANDLLSGRSASQVDQVGSEPLLLKLFEDAAQPAVLRALSLRMLRREHPALTTAKVLPLLEHADAELRLEALRLLSVRADAPAQDALRARTGDPLLGVDAVAGLSASTSAPETRKHLVGLLDGPLALEALRSLSGDLQQPEVGEAVGKLAEMKSPVAEKARLLLNKAGPRPASKEAWMPLASAAGDAVQGERVFFHPKGPQCFRCHRVNGRGGMVGPDLTTIGHSLDRARLAESILDPAREVAPMFVNWRVMKKDGDVVDGRLLGEEADGTLVLITAQAVVIRIKPKDVQEKQPSRLSIMPEGLQNGLTPREFMDLIEYLSRLR
jgi:hypothetical protein